MSDSNNFWKWMTVGIIIAVTALVCGYLVVKEFQDQQEHYNTALAANALQTNVQIVELRTTDQVLEQGINDLDAQQSADIARLEQAIRDQQNVIDSQQDHLTRMQDQIWALQNKNYDTDAKITSLETQVKALECEVWGDGCEGPEEPCGDCGAPYTCPYCGNRYPYDYPYYDNRPYYP